MADMKIDEATEATSLDGSEFFPIAKGSPAAPRKVDIDTVKNYIISALKDLTGATSVGDNDGFVLVQDNTSKKVTISHIAEAVLGILTGGTAATSLAGTDIIIVTDGEDKRCTTLAALKNYVLDGFTADMDIDGLYALENDYVRSDDAFPVFSEEFEENRKITASQVFDWIAKNIPLIDYKSSSLVSTDYLLMVSPASGNTPASFKKILLSTSGLKTNSAGSPASTTANNIPQWNDNQCNLKDGLSVQTSVRAANEASNSAIPTEAAVRTALSGVALRPSTNPTSNNVPQWDGTTGLMKDGLSVQTSVRAANEASNSAIPTEAAVRSAIAGISGTGVINHSGTVVSLTDLPSGYPLGTMLMADVVDSQTAISRGWALFVNKGNATTPDWYFIQWLKHYIPSS